MLSILAIVSSSQSWFIIKRAVTVSEDRCHVLIFFLFILTLIFKSCVLSLFRSVSWALRDRLVSWALRKVNAWIYSGRRSSTDWRTPLYPLRVTPQVSLSNSLDLTSPLLLLLLPLLRFFIRFSSAFFAPKKFRSLLRFRFRILSIEVIEIFKIFRHLYNELPIDAGLKLYSHF